MPTPDTATNLYSFIRETIIEGLSSMTGFTFYRTEVTEGQQATPNLYVYLGLEQSDYELLEDGSAGNHEGDRLMFALYGTFDREDDPAGDGLTEDKGGEYIETVKTLLNAISEKTYRSTDGTVYAKVTQFAVTNSAASLINEQGKFTIVGLVHYKTSYLTA